MKADVLIVSAWTHGLDEPIVLMQRFRPAAAGQFTLFGPVEIVIDGRVLASEEAAPLRAIVLDGIALHPSNVPWANWLEH